MAPVLPSSPTPQNFERYVRELVSPIVDRIAGGDERMTSTEVQASVKRGVLTQEEGALYLETVAKAHNLTKKARPNASTVTDKVGLRALIAGRKAAKGDGRISKGDALTAMPKDLAALFLYARGANQTSPTSEPSAPPATPPAPEPTDGYTLPSTLPALSKMTDGAAHSTLTFGDFKLTPRALAPAAASVAGSYSLGWPTFAQAYDLPAHQINALLTTEEATHRLAGILTLLAWDTPHASIQEHAASGGLGVATSAITSSEVSGYLAGALAGYDLEHSTSYNVSRLHAGFEWLAQSASHEPGVVLRRFQITADEQKMFAVMAISPADQQVRVFGWHNAI